MNNTIKNILIGSLVAMACAGIIIFSIEAQKSFLQILIGFVIFVIPFSLLSSFSTKLGSFFLVIFTVMTTYTISKFMYHDFWLGVLLASIIGGSIFYFRVFQYQPFSASDYKTKAIEKAKKSK
ncbi:MAG: hypothetical protein ACON48_01340 [Chitinophagales bacterium]